MAKINLYQDANRIQPKTNRMYLNGVVFHQAPHGISNHQQLHCLVTILYMLAKKTSRNGSYTRRASNAENVSMS